VMNAVGRIEASACLTAWTGRGATAVPDRHGTVMMSQIPRDIGAPIWSGKNEDDGLWTRSGGHLGPVIDTRRCPGSGVCL
jgi:hypothetical protein